MSRTSRPREAAILDALRQRLGFANDAQLSAWMGVAHSTLVAVRRGKHRVGPLTRLRLLERLGYQGRAWRAELEESALNVRLSRAGARLQAGMPPPAHDWAELIARLKAHRHCATDEALSAVLGVSRATLSNSRGGRTRLGVRVRLGILHRLDPFDLAALNALLDEVDPLVRWIAARPGAPVVRPRAYDGVRPSL